MKKHLLFIATALLLTACNSDVKKIMCGEPIMPVHATSDSTSIYLTDYLPTLDMSKVGKMSICGDYTLAGVSDTTLCIVGRSRSIETFSVSSIDIPVLPNHSYMQGFTTIGYSVNEVVVGFISFAKEEVAEPQIVAFVQNKKLEDKYITANEDGTFTISLRKLPACLKKGRSFLRVFAADYNFLYNDILVPLQDGKPVTDAADLTRHDANAQILYSLMIDRFFDGNADNNKPLCQEDVLPKVDYFGGDIKGITDKINEGFFNEMGISTIWISPITQNPTTAWGLNKDPYTRFSGYHGYWPIYNTKVDDRFGTDEELREMLATAHDHNINVILDYVANHVHIESPTLQTHPTWITDSILPDGRRNFELWDEARLTTWFDVHIPSLDLEREEVCDAMTDTALFWVKNFDFDGYRHDACKHIPLNYWRMFTHKMKTQLPDRQLWMIGETYGDAALISSYVKSGMLNAQFDFNIYHTAIDVFGKPDQSMRRLANVIEESCRTYGDHHTMGNISGNHDKCRFISLVGGAVRWDENDKAAGWHREIGVTADGDSAMEERAFKKALLLEVINLTIPGVPCIYQGDEYGQCGANDPDNRRMMRFDGLNPHEAQFRAKMLELTKLRRSSMPLIYGDYNLLHCDKDVIVYSRTYMGKSVYVAINNADEEKEALGYTIPANDYIITFD